MTFYPQPDPLDAAEAELDRRLTRALESAPAFTIPASFAARTAALAARLPAPTPAIPARFATIATRIAFAALVLAMFLFAPAAKPQATLPMLLEVLLAFEFVALTTWLSLRPNQ